MDKIQERIEEFAATGMTKFSRWELLSSYGQERVTKSIWRSLNEYFDEKAPDRDPNFIEVADVYVIFDANKIERIVDLV